MLQNREEALYEAQEHARVLAADAAPHRGVYQPLLAAPPAGPDPLDKLKWPYHHAADLRHIQRSALLPSPEVCMALLLEQLFGASILREALCVSLVMKSSWYFVYWPPFLLAPVSVYRRVCLPCCCSPFAFRVCH